MLGFSSPNGFSRGYLTGQYSAGCLAASGMWI